MPKQTYYAKHRDRLLAEAKAKRDSDPEYKEKLNARSKRWRENNRERFRDMQKGWMEQNPYYYFLNNARKRAKDQGVPYGLNISFIKSLEIPSVCPYLGIPIIKGEGKSSENSPSLDKIIPELGYVPGNVEFISSRANRLKSDATPEELEAIAERLKNLR